MIGAILYFVGGHSRAGPALHRAPVQGGAAVRRGGWRFISGKFQKSLNLFHAIILMKINPASSLKYKITKFFIFRADPFIYLYCRVINQDIWFQKTPKKPTFRAVNLEI